MDGVELTFEDDAILEIAKIAQAKKTGARGLRGVIESIVIPLMYELPETKTGIVITKQMVLDSLQEKEAA